MRLFWILIHSLQGEKLRWVKHKEIAYEREDEIALAGTSYFFFPWTWSSAAWAQIPPVAMTLTLDEAVTRALQSNAQIRIVEQDRVFSQERIREVGAGALAGSGRHGQLHALGGCSTSGYGTLC